MQLTRGVRFREVSGFNLSRNNLKIRWQVWLIPSPRGEGCPLVDAVEGNAIDGGVYAVESVLFFQQLSPHPNPLAKERGFEMVSKRICSERPGPRNHPLSNCDLVSGRSSGDSGGSGDVTPRLGVRQCLGHPVEPSRGARDL